MDLRDKAEPRVEKPKRETVAPSRAKLLSDRELPRFVTSSTAKVKSEPSLAIPNTAKEQPIRATPRNDSEEPI
jgi:hypothetical protein